MLLSYDLIGLCLKLGCILHPFLAQHCKILSSFNCYITRRRAAQGSPNCFYCYAIWFFTLKSDCTHNKALKNICLHLHFIWESFQRKGLKHSGGHQKRKSTKLYATQTEFSVRNRRFMGGRKGREY